MATLARVPARQLGYLARVILLPEDAEFEEITIQSPADERRVLWQAIMAPATIKDIARPFWPKLTDFNKYWPEYRSFIEQARLYDEAAMNMSGASAALLLYYSILNLAKAELMISRPADVYQQTVYHGLAYKPSQATIRRDFVTTQGQKGAFCMLYESRTGESIKQNERLPIQALLRNLIDVSMELSRVGLQPSRVDFVDHYVASNGNDESWSVIPFFREDHPALTQTAARKHLAEHFEEARDWGNYYNGLAGIRAVTALQTKDVLKRGANIPQEQHWQDVARRTAKLLAAMWGFPTYKHFELAPSLAGDRWLGMRPDLARYAAVYYCSSVVRYRPSLLHSGASNEAAWLLNAFVDEARLPLLRSAVLGVTGRYLRLTAA